MSEQKQILASDYQKCKNHFHLAWNIFLCAAVMAFAIACYGYFAVESLRRSTFYAPLFVSGTVCMAIGVACLLQTIRFFQSLTETEVVIQGEMLPVCKNGVKAQVLCVEDYDVLTDTIFVFGDIRYGSEKDAAIQPGHETVVLIPRIFEAEKPLLQYLKNQKTRMDRPK